MTMDPGTRAVKPAVAARKPSEWARVWTRMIASRGLRPVMITQTIWAAATAVSFAKTSISRARAIGRMVSRRCGPCGIGASSRMVRASASPATTLPQLRSPHNSTHMSVSRLAPTGETR